MNNLNLAVRRLRAAIGVSQTEFGNLTGMSLSMVSAVEKGTRNMSKEGMDQLARALGLSLEELELAASADFDDLPPKFARLAAATQNVLINAIRAQLGARRALGIEFQN